MNTYSEAAARVQYAEQCIEDADGVGRRVKGELGEAALVWVRSRGMLTDRQFVAGEALGRDWELAGLGPRVTMQWDEAPSSGYSRGAPGAPDPAITQLSARQRFDGAIEEAGAGLADILWRVGWRSEERRVGRECGRPC